MWRGKRAFKRGSAEPGSLEAEGGVGLGALGLKVFNGLREVVLGDKVVSAFMEKVLDFFPKGWPNGYGNCSGYCAQAG